MTEVAVDETGTVEILKVVDVLPVGTMTLAGTVAAVVLLLESDTVIPPGGAGAVRLTVPIEEVPPVRLFGAKVMELTSTPTEPEPAYTAWYEPERALNIA